MNAYRSAAAPRPTVALVVRGKRAWALTIFLIFFGLAPTPFMDFVSITCTRPETPQRSSDEGSCMVRDRGVLVRKDREFPLRDVTALRVDERGGDSGTLSRLVLVTTSGEIMLGSGWDNLNLDGRRATAARFAVFRKSDAPRFEGNAGYGGLVFGAIWFAACVLAILLNHGRRVRVVIDPPRGAIRVRRWFRTIDLPLSRDVKVVGEKDSDGQDTWKIVAPAQQIPLPQNVRPEDVRAFCNALEAALPES